MKKMTTTQAKQTKGGLFWVYACLAVVDALAVGAAFKAAIRY